MLGKAALGLPVGYRPFKDVTPSSALAALRDRLRRLNVEKADCYRTQDFRRGHCRDMQSNGSTLHEILSAGEWKSPAFLLYADLEQLEHDSVVEAHLAESSDEDK